MLAATTNVGCHDRHLENLLGTSTPELKVQLTGNFVDGIVMTCRSKFAKIVQIGNPRWLPEQPS